jgi:hypothetical protein
MSTPSSTEELTKQIEQLVEQYVAQSHRAAREALERAFGSAAPATKANRRSTSARGPRRAGGQRRSAEAIEHVAARLYELVRDRPGESMVAFATELAVPARTLERPMTLLKREGRVRSVGQRQRTRYFPAVGSKAAKAAS